MIKTCIVCGNTSETVAVHVHHVVGRIGPNKDAPENLVELCYVHHHMWHTARPEWLEDTVYRYMKTKWGTKFPIEVNKVPYMTKWLIAAEGRANER